MNNLLRVVSYVRLHSNLVRVIGAVGIFLCASAASAAESAGSAALNPEQRVNGLLVRILSVAGTDMAMAPPTVQLSRDSRYALASVAGKPGRIIITPTYLQSVSDGALMFALAHELAHLQLAHHARLRHMAATGLSSSATQDRAALQKALMGFHHEIEYEADELAMTWCLRLSACTMEDVREALVAAYEGIDRQSTSHPSFSARILALKQPALREKYKRALSFE